MAGKLIEQTHTQPEEIWSPKNNNFHRGNEWENTNFVAYCPIVQKPYGLGVAKNFLRSWQLKPGCALCWASVYSLIRKTWRVEFIHRVTPTEK